MAWTDTTRKNENVATGVSSLNVTLSSVATDSFIAAGASTFSSSVSMAVADDLNGSYSVSFFADQNSATGSLNYRAASASGNLTVTFTPSASSDIWAAVHEFAGGHLTSPASGTPVTGLGSGSPASTGSMTPADNDVLLVAVLGTDGLGAVTENNAGEGFTLSNESEATQAGSLVFKIISGAPGTPSHSWALPANDWGCGIAAFKPAPLIGGVRGGGGGGYAAWAEVPWATMPSTGPAAFTLVADPGVYSISGAAATLAAGRLFNAESGAYILTGFAADLAHGFLMNAEPGAYAITGFAATLLADRMLNAESGTYTVTGAAAEVLAARVLGVDPGSYLVTGAAAELVFSGGAVVSVSIFIPTYRPRRR